MKRHSRTALLPLIACTTLVAGIATAASDFPKPVPPAVRVNSLPRGQVIQQIRPLSPEELRAGQPGKLQGLTGKPLTCRFKQLSKAPNGMTPKFKCILTDARGTPILDEDGDERDLKIKYSTPGPFGGNMEVYTEMAVSRLLWATGFGADRYYRPTVVTCLDCCSPRPDPAAPPCPGKVVPFPTAITEDKLDGKTLEVTEDQGWAWDELDAINPARGGAPKEQVDALRIMASLIAYADSKSEQQRIICKKGRTGYMSGPACGFPIFYMQDLGVSLGGGYKGFGLPGMSKLPIGSFGKMDIQGWLKEPIITPAANSPSGCLTHIDQKMTRIGRYRPVPVGRGGVQLLLGQLKKLTPEQMIAIFEGAHVEEVTPFEVSFPDGSSMRTAESPNSISPRRVRMAASAWAKALQFKIAQLAREGAACR